MGDDRGCFAPTTPGCRLCQPVDPAACTADAPMWCDRLGLRGRARRDTIGARGDGSSAPEKAGEAHAVEGLVNETYIIKKELPFSLKKLAYLVAA